MKNIKISVSFFILFLTGCAPNFFMYQYISLENFSDISIDERKEIEGDKLYFSESIPVQYSLKRAEYEIKFLITSESYLPRIKVISISKSNNELSVKPKIDMSYRSEIKGVLCIYWTDNNKEKDIFFGWSADCPYESERNIISFDVLDPSGEVVGSEDIPFKIKESGFYYIIDAI